MIDEVDCGIASDSNDIDELYDKMIDAEAHRDEFAKKGKNGLRYFYENFTKKECLNNLLTIMNNG